MPKTRYPKILSVPLSIINAWNRSGGLIGLMRLIGDSIRQEGLKGFLRRAKRYSRKYGGRPNYTLGDPEQGIAWINQVFGTVAPEHVSAPLKQIDYFTTQAPDARVIAFYLPQFHPFPENDSWWGVGFTEWRNVTRALPQFIGHYQPHLPADLGFYDLRTPETMPMQATLAKRYGIHGFCFYFYWFGGKVLMEAPLRRWLEDDSISMPFCLCWANENWTRRWDGLDSEILIAQRHSASDDIAFLEYVSPYLLDPRYIRLEGKPVLLVYAASYLPDARRTAERWRQWWRERHGGELVLVCAHSLDRSSPLDIGFDACVEFPPVGMDMEESGHDVQTINPDFSGRIYDYSSLVEKGLRFEPPHYPKYRGVMPGWDNTPRRKTSGFIFQGNTPELYRQWLHETATYSRWFSSGSEPAPIFVNAWNEWAEGAHLEPDLRYGHAYLKATAEALASSRDNGVETLISAAPKYSHAIILHLFYPELVEEFGRRLAGLKMDIWITVVDLSILPLVQRHFPCANILRVANRGRDVAPFLSTLRKIRTHGYDLVLKLHSKRSPHRVDGDRWRQEILSHLLPDDFDIDRLSKEILSTADIGMIAPKAHRHSIAEHMGSNQYHIARLERLTGFVTTSEDRFVAGSMFWFRPSALDVLLDASIQPGDFEFEQGQLDGTLAHAMERFLGVVVRASGYRIVDSVFNI